MYILHGYLRDVMQGSGTHIYLDLRHRRGIFPTSGALWRFRVATPQLRHQVAEAHIIVSTPSAWVM